MINPENGLLFADIKLGPNDLAEVDVSLAPNIVQSFTYTNSFSFITFLNM